MRAYDSRQVEQRVAEVIRIARELTYTIPVPRGTPYYSMDSAFDFGFETFEPLSRKGIFRKYEHVLFLNPGQGGVARWLATRLGCRVLGVGEDAADMAIAEALSRRANLEGTARFLAGVADQLPLASGRFTHVWGAAHQPVLGAGVASEAWRVLRPGGHFAWQQSDIVSDVESEASLEVLRRVGFEAVEHGCEEAAKLERSAVLARQALARGDVNRAAAPLETSSPGRRVQLFARRPA